MSDFMPTDRELEALKLLWEHGQLTVRAIWKQLSQGDRELAYTTVLSLLQTMEKKGLVKHEGAGKAYVYTAAVGRERTFRTLATRFLDRVFDGAMDEYLVRALESRPPSLEELERLETLIARAKKQARQPRRKGDSQ